MFSNDPENPKLRLTLKGEVVVDLKVQPRSVNFGQLSKGEQGSSSFVLTISDPQKTTFKSIALEDETHFSLEEGEGDFTQGKVYNIKFNGADEIGSIRSGLNIEYENEKGVQTQAVSIRAAVVSDLRYATNLTFSRRGKDFAHRTVIFTSRSGDEVEILEVINEGQEVKTEVIEKKAKQAKLRLLVADNDKRYETPVRGSIKVRTNNTDEPIATVGYVISEGSGKRSPVQKRDNKLKLNPKNANQKPQKLVPKKAPRMK